MKKKLNLKSLEKRNLEIKINKLIKFLKKLTKKTQDYK